LEDRFNSQVTDSKTMVRGATGRESDPREHTQSTLESARELAALLQALGMRVDSPALQSFVLVDGAAARALKNIRDWMTYLPEDCVRSMVGDGWHWST
jgi:hypothetical protein